MGKIGISLFLAIIVIAIVAVGNPGAMVVSPVASSSTVVGEATPANPLNRRDHEIGDREGPVPVIDEIVVASALEEGIVFAEIIDSEIDSEEDGEIAPKGNQLIRIIMPSGAAG